MVHSPIMTSLRRTSTPDAHAVDDFCRFQFKWSAVAPAAKTDQENQPKRRNRPGPLNLEDQAFTRRPSSSSDVFPRTMIMAQKTHSVVILGELSVGKSALCKCFFHSDLAGHSDCMYEDQALCTDHVGQHAPNGQALIHHVFERPVLADGEPCRIRILDVNTEKHLVESGEDQVAASLRSFVGNKEACIVAYAVTDKGTYVTAKEILKVLYNDGETFMSEKSVILVGNKCDLVRKRQVSSNEGSKLAKHYNVKFIETSATLNQNVEELFFGIIRQIRLREPLSPRRRTLAELGQMPQSRDKRPPLMKRVSSTLLSPFNNMRTRRVADNQAEAAVESRQEGAKTKGKRGTWKLRRSKTAEIHPNRGSQDL